MDQNAVIYPRGATQHSGDAVVKTPSRDPGDPEIAYGAEPTLVLPEKAKCSSTPERSRHVIPFAFLQGGFDYLPDAVQEDFHILLGGLDEQFPVGILAHVLSEEIKALLHVRGDCLRGRKFQPPFVQKLLYEGLNFSFQQFFGSTGDDKVICVADEIHTGTFSSQGGETPLCRKLLLQEPLQSIQRTICERG